MKIIAFILLLASLCNGATLVGKTDCTEGPDFWCKNIATAKKCSSVRYCLNNHWTNTVSESSVPCTVCKDGFEYVEYLMEKKATKSQVRSALYDICNKLPDQLNEECKQILSENFDMIYEEAVIWLKNGELLCSAMGLCASEIPKRLNDLPQIAKVALYKNQLPAATVQITFDESSNNDCNDCIAFYNDFGTVIQNKPVITNYWLNLIVQECDLLGPGTSSLCKEEMKKEFLSILQQLSQLNAASVCKEVGMCSSINKAQPSPSNSQCDDCRAFFTDVQGYIANNGSFMYKIEDIVKNECNEAGLLKSTCLSISKQALSGLWNILSQSSVESTCETLFFCQELNTPLTTITEKTCGDCKHFLVDLKYSAFKNSSLLNYWKSIGMNACSKLNFMERSFCEDHINGVIHQLVDQGLQLNINETCSKELLMCDFNHDIDIKPIPGDTCSDCIIAAQDIKMDVKINPSKLIYQLTKAVDVVCDQVPSFLRGMCLNQVSSNIFTLVQTINSTSAESLCSQAAFCSQQSAPSKLLVTSTNSSNKITGDTVCSVCEFVSEELSKYISENSTEEEIKVELEKVCQVLPELYKDACKDMIDLYSTEIIGAISNGLSTDQLCSYLGLCPKNDRLPKSFYTCEICEYATGKLEKLIFNKKTATEITNAMKEVCIALPYSMQDSCNYFFTKYEQEIIQLIENGLSPKLICAGVGLCSSKKENIKATVATSSPYCGVCMLVAQQLDSLLSQKSTQAEIEQALEQVCGYLPSMYKTECDQLVTSYTPMIIQLLVQEMNPKQLCSLLHLCPTQNIKATVTTSSPYCGVCMLVAQQLDSLLSQKSTQAEIEQALEQVCGYLPSMYKTECDQLVTSYTPMIIQLLVQEMNPKQLCSLLHLCPTQNIKATVATSSPYCGVCMLVAQQLDSLLSQKSTQAEIEQALEQVCGYLPSMYKTECDQLVTSYTPMIIQLLVQEMNPKQLCSLLHLCPTQINQMAVKKCFLLEKMYKKINQFLSSDQTEEDIIELLEKACQLVKGDLKMECVESINGYTAEIIDQILLKLDPKNICPFINQYEVEPIKEQNIKDDFECQLCTLVANELDSLISENSTEKDIEEALDNVCSILPDSLKSSCKEFIDSNTPQLIDLLLQKLSPDIICKSLKLCTSFKEQDIKDDFECQLCTLVANELDSLISENSTEKDIEEALDNVCSILPDSLKSSCKEFIDSNTPQLIDLLLQKLSPDIICKSLKLCTSFKEQDLKDDFECQLCTLVANELDSLISENSTEKDIEEALDNVCSILPDSLKSSCKEFIDSNTPQLIDLLLQKLSPDIICKSLKLCTSFKEQDIKDDFECQLCTLVANELDSLISENSTEKDIEEALDNVCSILPDSLKSSCKEFIDSYTPMLIDLLLQKLSPDIICKSLGACSSAKNQLPRKPSNVKVFTKSSTKANLTGSVPCDVCKLMLEYLDQELASNSTQEEIEVELKKVCSELPTKLEVMCQDIVNEYIPEIIQAVIDQTDPTVICQNLGVCPEEAKKLRFGVDSCTFGPSYWCQNKSTALQCKALSHCMKHVW